MLCQIIASSANVDVTTQGWARGHPPYPEHGVEACDL